MTTAEYTLILAAFNALAVPLLVSARAWTKRVERRLNRIERHLDLDPITNH